MTDSKTPKNDQLRAMRERNEAERLAKIKAKPAPTAVELHGPVKVQYTDPGVWKIDPELIKARIAAAEAALSNAGLTSKSNKSNKTTFDRNAYQREYMRKKRAKAALK